MTCNTPVHNNVQGYPINELPKQVYSYQKTVYKAAKMPQIITEPIINPVDTRNIDVSISMVWVSFSFAGFVILITIMVSTIIPKVIDILSKKG